MKNEKIKLSGSKGATLELYLHNIFTELGDKERPLVLVIPGGGYFFTSEREAEPVAMEYYRAGFHAAVLRYSVGEDARNMQPMAEAFTCIKLIRENAKEWRVKPDSIAVCGFSAGGHLAASCGTMWNEPELIERLGGTYKPDAMILCYPVISSGEFAHRESFFNLSGSMEDDKANEFFSLEKRVDGDTPQTFLWHTENDELVPLENTLLFAGALRKNKVPFECHIFNKGSHGLSICNMEVGTENIHCRKWMELSIDWLNMAFEE